MKYLETCSFVDEKQVSSLSSKTVTVVGLGGIGSTLAQILVRNNINVRIVDKSRVEEKDVSRQTLYIEEDLTKFKAKQAKKRLEEINKNVTIKTFHEELHEDNIFLLESDLIIDTTNHMPTSLMIDSYTGTKRIPLLFANYAGEKGNVYFTQGKLPRLRNLQKELELSPIKKKGVFSPITTIIAGILASKALKFLLKIELDERIIHLDLLKGEYRRSGVDDEPAKPVAKKVAKTAKKTVRKTTKVAKKKTTTKKATTKTRSSKATGVQKRKVSRKKTTKKSAKKAKSKKK